MYVMVQIVLQIRHMYEMHQISLLMEEIFKFPYSRNFNKLCKPLQICKSHNLIYTEYYSEGYV